MYIINEVVWKGKCEKKCNKEKNYKEISWNWGETLKKLIEIILIKSIWTKIGRHRVNLVKKKKKVNLSLDERKVKVEGAQSCLTLCDPIDFIVHGILQARILAWEAFPFSRASSQPGIEPRPPACRWILYQLDNQWSLRGLEWVAYPFSRGSSRPRNWTRVSCTAGEFYQLSYSGGPYMQENGTKFEIPYLQNFLHLNYPEIF